MRCDMLRIVLLCCLFIISYTGDRYRLNNVAQTYSSTASCCVVAVNSLAVRLACSIRYGAVLCKNTTRNTCRAFCMRRMYIMREQHTFSIHRMGSHSRSLWCERACDVLWHMFHTRRRFLECLVRQVWVLIRIPEAPDVHVRRRQRRILHAATRENRGLANTNARALIAKDV